MAEKLLTDVTTACGLEERKGKALIGQLLGSVHDLASKLHEPSSKALKEAVPQLDEWKQIAKEEKDASDSQQPASSSDGGAGVLGALTAAAEKVVPGLGGASSMVTSMPQLKELMERLGVSKTDKPDAPAEVASSFSTFLAGGIMPAEIFDKVKGTMPWLSGEDSPSMPSQMLHKAEEAMEGAAEAATKAAVGAYGKITGASKEESETKQKGIMQNLRSGFKSLFRKANKGKEPIAQAEGSAAKKEAEAKKEPEAKASHDVA